MGIKNKVMLITYADSLGENLKDLETVLVEELKGAIGGVHLLPFFPSTGDRGFAPTDYRIVDSKFGTWDDIESLGEKYYLMFDFMVNHISKQSPEFKDFKLNHNQSEYAHLFIRYDDYWPVGRPTKADIDLIYKRKDKAPFQEVHFADGSKEEVWNTFGEEQIDLNVSAEITKQFIKNTLEQLINHGCDIVRLDAFAYAVKKLDTNCFFVEPEIWDLLNEIREITIAKGAEILPEIHEHFSIQHKIADHDFYIYDFALPMVTLYTLYSGKTNRLSDWLKKSPMKQFTTLDTHDGIGVVDAKDILSDEETLYTSEELYKVGANVKKIFSSEAYNNLDIYQINSTYYSALGDNDDAYLAARAIQIFAPGIPQIYYVGLLAGKNDLELLEATKEGRNINRHYYQMDEIKVELERPVVRKLLDLLTFRNESSAFDLHGTIEISTPSEHEILILRSNKQKNQNASLLLNAQSYAFTIKSNGKELKI
ncbi:MULTISPECIES: sucrose phosphorylase [unclassified Enterococcus]|uniref:sucrose phosphorylase n=1 Tax=unclassified Enterococcus TaxID=2608891 RepID=UPI0015542A1C|nr:MULTISPECIES: sucrose phosphorylase [unclassified Enterococcus]MBS7577774.1 sucrose phosphorylase [Enterococcus sp. MMGLQ5-2]MBS7585034.1 sucrose phosphorylase [Enterococcus sp. MMGLQ5-1]NPD12890.1 sucrose phosphorylase [Enterococcus sp. MMGLQ5-1]NPD37604.1 sucrose phosphorylase [Enterococcus sp. MMGLQ5-2]